MALVNKTCNIGGVTCNVWIVEVEPDKFMYGGHAIAEFLGYKCPKNALRDHVKPQWRKNWHEIKGALIPYPLVTSPEQPEVPANWQPNTMFISEAGVYSLIMRSKLPAAEEFQRWLFEEVLPELRRIGKYNIQEQQQASCSTEVVNYDKKLADAQMESLQLKLELSEANTKIAIAKHDTTISEIQRNYERQIAEYKERKYKHHMEMKD